jgi:hypothetical protein
LRRRQFTILMLLLASTLSAQPFDPFQPANPVVMGRGGSFTADATGYNSFFYNPAGFARSGELTLASANVWAFMDRELVELARGMASQSLGLSGSVSARAVDPDAYAGLVDNFEEIAAWVEDEDPAVMETILQNAAGDAGITFEPGDDIADVLAAAGTDDIVAFLEAVDVQADALATSPLYNPTAINDLLNEVDAALPSGYLRVGAQAGLGYVGNGIGLGLFANAEATVDGTNILQAYGTAYNTITFVGGLGLTFGRLNLGIAVRPTVFGYSRVNAAPILSSYLSGGTIDFATMFTSTVYYGSGLGVDVGALYELGPFSFGLAVRDLLRTQINYSKTDFDTYLGALTSASLPVGSALSADELANAWTIPMKVNAGVQFNPDLGVLTYLIDPKLSVDLLDMTSAIRTWQSGEQVTVDQVVGMLNFGGEVNLLRFLAVRAGYYGGYLSAGVGLDIFLLDINAAIAGDFGRDDTGAWGFTNVGGSVEVAIRF